jgi:hypothetical protein
MLSAFSGWVRQSPFPRPRVRVKVRARVRVTVRVRVRVCVRVRLRVRLWVRVRVRVRVRVGSRWEVAYLIAMEKKTAVLLGLQVLGPMLFEDIRRNSVCVTNPLAVSADNVRHHGHSYQPSLFFFTQRTKPTNRYTRVHVTKHDALIYWGSYFQITIQII